MRNCSYLLGYISAVAFATSNYDYFFILDTPELKHYTSAGTHYTQILQTTMDSHAESSSAQSKTAEGAAIEGRTRRAAADGPWPVNQTSTTSHQPGENRPSNNPKLDEMLQLIQKQLDLQQKQLDLLRHIAGTIGEDEPANSKAVGKQVETFIQRDDSDRDDWDPELVMKWQISRGPDSPESQKIGDEFLRFCDRRDLFWFSPNNKNIRSMIGFGETTGTGTSTPVQRTERLRRYWPQSLGTTSSEGDSWTFLLEAGMSLMSMWYSYEDKRDISVCLHRVICT
jgi:hypothetical protein